MNKRIKKKKFKQKIKNWNKQILISLKQAEKGYQKQIDDIETTSQVLFKDENGQMHCETRKYKGNKRIY